jgi:hypothetical protein
MKPEEGAHNFPTITGRDALAANEGYNNTFLDIYCIIDHADMKQIDIAYIKYIVCIEEMVRYVHQNLFIYYTKYLVELFHSVLIEQSSLWKGNRRFFLKSDS